MRITSIPQIYRHLNRWREILAVLSKYELAGWIGRVGPESAKDLLKAARGGPALARMRWETRVRHALAELGPTFIKLGQILSTRPDLVGVEMTAELRHLQAHVPPDKPEVVRRLVEQELGRPIEEAFRDFEGEALASASIGQVHCAKLPTGEAVVVKVQREGIEHKVAVDLDILAGLAMLAERLPEFHNYRPRAVVAEFQRSIRREIDFQRECRNMQQFRQIFENNKGIHIPRPFPELSTRRVLVMERLRGIPLTETQRLTEAGADFDALARRGAELCLEMIFQHGIYHADPHPGNVLLEDCGVIGLLDFGMVGRIDERLHEDVGDLLMAVTQLDAEHLVDLIVRLGDTPSELDHGALEIDVADFVAYYGNVPLDQFDLTGALNEMIEVIRRYNIMLPSRIAMLLKALVTLEGTARFLSPRFSLVEVMKPYHKTMLWRRLSPRRRLRRYRRILGEMERLLEMLPRGMMDIFQQVQSGRFDVHLDHRGLEPSVKQLVLGMLTSALFLGSSLLLSRDVPPVFRGISVPGALGATVSIVLGFRLWRAIYKSGHFHRKP